MTRKYSSEYKNLQPYVVEDIRKVVTAAGTTGGGGTPGVTDHGRLTGLSDDDHPQYLTPVRGDARYIAVTRTLTAGNGLTGGGDLSANRTFDVAVANTGAAGLTVEADAVRLTSSSSPGAAARILATTSGGALTLVDETISGSLYVTGTLDFGTNTITEDATYLQVAGSKAVKFNQNIGNANWTLYNAGGYTTTGSISITGAAGDLTVGSNVLFVDNSQANVGINMAPDSQFALDINGPARATYWIGPHAIQLKDVLLLAHFDGRAPYETNYTGEPNGHMGQVPVVSGGLIFRPGKFYKAAQMAAYTVNLCTNPSFETNSTGWSGYSSGTVARSSTQALYGTYSLAVTAGAANRGAQITVSGLSASTGHTLSAWVYCDTSITIKIGGTDNVDKDHGDTSTTIAAATWTRVSRTITTDSHTSVILRIFSTTAATFYVDAVQVEAASVATPYCDGSLGGYDANGIWYAAGNGHSWTGTAHASTSARGEGRLTYRTPGNFDPLVGTAMCWVRFDAIGICTILASEENGGLAVIANLNTNAIDVSRKNEQTLISASVTWSVGSWFHVAVTWSGLTVKAYVNGAQVGTTATAAANLSTATAYYVGRWINDLYTLNGLIDDLCILRHASPDDEVLSIYESNAPVFAETSTFSFRPTPKGLIWADDEGLWMRDTAGNSVFGIYGGDAGTKSWASFTLSAGDLVIGNNAVGSSAILWTKAAGTFGFYGAGNSTPQVEIATDGRLTAGAGKVALDSTGFKAYNASLVETININADGIYMGDGGARTTIASWTSGNRIQWYSAGEIYEATPETYLDDSSVSRTLYPLVIRGVRIGNDAALIELAAVKSSDGAGAKIIIGEGFRLKGYFAGAGPSYNTNRVVHAIADDVILESTNLQLLGQTTSTGAVGTYAGKIKVRIGGTDRYIPYYAS